MNHPSNQELFECWYCLGKGKINRQDNSDPKTCPVCKGKRRFSLWEYKRISSYIKKKYEK